MFTVFTNRIRPRHELKNIYETKVRQIDKKINKFHEVKAHRSNLEHIFCCAVKIKPYSVRLA